MRPDRHTLALIVASGLCSAASAADFTPGNLVVVSVSNYGTGGSGALVLKEYTTSGVFVGDTVVLPDSGPDALSLPDVTNHDRHLHLSSDGRYLVLAAYNFEPDPVQATGDPSGLSASVAPRVAALIRFDGVVNSSTRLTADFEATSIRGAFTTDGCNIWIAGDNASGATTTGGLRYTTVGSGTSTNLSQVQATGGPKSPDNVRDVNVFDSQLYDCSGSSSSIGKAVFTVGSGLPTSGSQTLTTMNTDGASTSSFALLDLDAAIAGPDVLYAATSAAGDGIHKYVKQTNGTWAARGYLGFGGVEHVIATANSNGSVTVYAGGPLGITAFTDAAPLTGSLSGSVSSFIVVPDEGFSLGGFDFAPSGCFADYDGNLFVNGDDFDRFVADFELGGPCADVDGNGFVNGDDFDSFVIHFEAGC